MKTRIHRSVRHALLVDERQLETLSEFLRSKCQKIEFTVGCSDGSQIITSDIKEILAFENPTFRRIEWLDVEATSSFADGASVHIQAGILLHNVIKNCA